MDFQLMLGVDMSKDWFHVCIMNKKLVILLEQQVKNDRSSIAAFISQLKKEFGVEELSSLYMVMEHTGIYVSHLVKGWLSQGGRLSLVAANKISEHLGLRPGQEEKTDQLDARRIAEYGCRYADKLECYQAKSMTMKYLQRLQRQREQLVDTRTRLTNPLRESQRFDEAPLHALMAGNIDGLLKELNESIKRIEQQIKQLIRQDEGLKELFERISSVVGIGLITATELLIATNGFMDFRPNQAKAFARYAGCVPQRRQSGKKNRKAKASKRANQRIKKLLTTAACAALKTKSELRLYYDRKHKQGKPHLVIINALRNKLIHRLFAVVRNQVMYQRNLNLCLQQP